MNRKFVILGHHNFGLSLIIENLYANHGTEIEIDIISNFPDHENRLRNYKFALPQTKINEIQSHDWSPSEGEIYFNSAMSPISRMKLFEFFKENFDIEASKYGNSLHPQSAISHSATLGYGCLLSPNISISPFNKIGDFVIFSRNSSIGHHSEIGRYCNICPGVNIASEANIGEGVFIGTGSTVIEGITIGQHSIIGAHSLVTKSIPPGVIAYGIPAKVIRENVRG